MCFFREKQNANFYPRFMQAVVYHPRGLLRFIAKVYPPTAHLLPRSCQPAEEARPLYITDIALLLLFGNSHCLCYGPHNISWRGFGGYIYTSLGSHYAFFHNFIASWGSVTDQFRRFQDVMHFLWHANCPNICTINP